MRRYLGKRLLYFVLFYYSSAPIIFVGAGCTANQVSGIDGSSDSRAGGGDMTGGANGDMSGGGSGDMTGGNHDLALLPGPGDCHSDAECAPGKCVELTPGGFRVCDVPPMEATACTHGAQDQCCTSKDCTSPEKCFEGPVIPRCLGVVMLPANQCAGNGCQRSADCPNNGVCIPAGALSFKVSGCLPTGCHVNADCTAKPSGVCATVFNSCCSTVAQGLFCVYPGEGCRTSADCKGGHCAINGNLAHCVPGPAICPA